MIKMVKTTNCIMYLFLNHRCKKKQYVRSQNINKPVPHAPDYQYKYTPGIHRQPHNNPLLQNKNTFIDPHTGTVYEGYNIS